MAGTERIAPQDSLRLQRGKTPANNQINLQERQASNPEPLVLETSALPIELRSQE